MLYGDYMDPDALPEDRAYEEVKDIGAMYPVVQQCLDEYNNVNKKKMHLVTFRYICRRFLSRMMNEVFCIQHISMRISLME